MAPDSLVPTRRHETARAVLGAVSGGLLGGSGLFAVGALALSPWLFIPAGALLLATGIVLAVRAGLGAAAAQPAVPGGAAHIGLGADVHDNAHIEPGAVVEMGATVRDGALVQSGAVVRMGATVGKNATIESGAVVGWGATVEEGAVVQRDASVGAGATVRRGAIVASGRHVGAGGTVHASATQKALGEGSPAAAARATDSRAQRIEQLCDQLDAELRQGSQPLKEFLSTSDKSVGSLRETCRTLLAREQTIRREVTPELLERLDKERAALQERIDAAQDEEVRASLRAAAAAIDEQREQRALLKRNADRLDAELTRLLWTIEVIVSRLVHVRSSGGLAADPELERGLGSLRVELGAVSESLESVNEEERASLRQRVRS